MRHPVPHLQLAEGESSLNLGFCAGLMDAIDRWPSVLRVHLSRESSRLRGSSSAHVSQAIMSFPWAYSVLGLVPG